LGYNYFSGNGSQQRIGVNERSLTGQIGIDLAVGETAGIGVAAAYSDGDGRFSAAAGGYDVSAVSGRSTGARRSGRSSSAPPGLTDRCLTTISSGASRSGRPAGRRAAKPRAITSRLPLMPVSR
jgi:hypothetical protein